MFIMLHKSLHMTLPINTIGFSSLTRLYARRLISGKLKSQGLRQVNGLWVPTGWGQPEQGAARANADDGGEKYLNVLSDLVGEIKSLGAVSLSSRFAAGGPEPSRS